MAYLLAALAFLVFGGIGWYTADRQDMTGTVLTRALMLAGVLMLLMADGSLQQVVAGGMVGLMVGELAVRFTRRELSSTTRGGQTL